MLKTHSIIRSAIALSLGLSAFVNCFPVREAWAQPIPAEVRQKIKDAPFSQMFTVENAYLVKDQDYNPAIPDIGVSSLWGDIPEKNRLHLLVRYCFQDASVLHKEARLSQIILLDEEKPLVTIDQLVNSTVAVLEEVLPPRQVLYNDPFWDPFDSMAGSIQTVYIPAVKCSSGGSRFNLMPVKSQLAQLPVKTLRVKFVFSNGNVQKANLGQETVSAIKQLPTVRQSSAQ